MKQGHNKKDIVITEQLCNGLNTWLKQRKLSLIENYKGRATCVLLVAQKKLEFVDKKLKKKHNNQLNSLIINAIRSAFYEISALASEEFKALTCQVKLYINPLSASVALI